MCADSKQARDVFVMGFELCCGCSTHPTRRFGRLCVVIETTPNRFGGRLQAHSRQHSHQSSLGHRKVGQRKQRVKLLRVLGQVPGARLHIAKLGFDHPKRMLDLGPDIRSAAC